MREVYRLKVFNPVMEEGGFCAELLRFSRPERDNDRIDEGTLPYIPLCSGHVAQSGLFSSGHPIVPDVAQGGAGM